MSGSAVPKWRDMCSEFICSINRTVVFFTLLVIILISLLLILVFFSLFTQPNPLLLLLLFLLVFSLLVYFCLSLPPFCFHSQPQYCLYFRVDSSFSLRTLSMATSAFALPALRVRNARQLLRSAQRCYVLMMAHVRLEY